MSKKQISKLISVVLPVIGLLIADFATGYTAEWHHYVGVIVAVGGALGYDIAVNDDEDVKTP